MFRMIFFSLALSVILFVSVARSQSYLERLSDGKTFDLIESVSVGGKKLYRSDDLELEIETDEKGTGHYVVSVNYQGTPVKGENIVEFWRDDISFGKERYGFTVLVRGENFIVEITINR